jgi:putative hydrolase of the HAD superfamily
MVFSSDRRSPGADAAQAGDSTGEVAVSPIKNVIFDFGGVLVRWNPQEIIAGFYPDEPSRELLRRMVFQHPDWLEMDRGTLHEEQALERFAARMGRPLEEMQALLQRVKESLTPITESFAIVQDLDRRGFGVYGLSNISVAIFSYLRDRYDLWRPFKGIVLSGEVKMVKPDARIFEYLCDTHGLVPSETVFIDDHPPNIEAAGRLGFQTILFSEPQQCAAELEVIACRR